MKIPFLKIFKSPSKNVPEVVKTEFTKQFSEAKNIEWEYKKNSYEAIFYLEGREYIAQFSDHGELKETKKNLWLNELPELISDICLQQGEIMNVIEICRGNYQFSEVIIRNMKLKRKLFLLNPSGKIISSHKL